VDAADYVLWRSTMGQPITPPGSGPDGNASGTVDTGDYVHWSSRFGKVTDHTAAGSSVPEPVTLTLLFLIGPQALFILPRRARLLWMLPQHLNAANRMQE
jgi:hypothetical protein